MLHAPVGTASYGAGDDSRCRGAVSGELLRLRDVRVAVLAVFVVVRTIEELMIASFEQVGWTSSAGRNVTLTWLEQKLNAVC
jgi:hypothetical protein